METVSPMILESPADVLAYRAMSLPMLGQQAMPHGDGLALHGLHYDGTSVRRKAGRAVSTVGFIQIMGASRWASRLAANNDLMTSGKKRRSRSPWTSCPRAEAAYAAIKKGMAPRPLVQLSCSCERLHQSIRTIPREPLHRSSWRSCNDRQGSPIG